MGNTPYRGKKWSRISLSILERDNFTCQDCGFVGNRQSLDCHHVIPCRLFNLVRDANKPSNLLTLCKSCHSKADNKFWKQHPNLFSSKRFPYPTVPPRLCIKCGKLIKHPSGHQTICKACKTFTCDVCGKVFTTQSKGSRIPRFCSCACNIAFRKQNAKWLRVCQDCGKPIEGGRYYCLDCWLKDPAGRVRPGHKPGRRPKCQTANPTSED